eukprot:218998_1
MVCGVSQFVERSINALVFVLATISVIWWSIQYYKRRSSNANKCLHYMTMAFFVFIALANGLWCVSCVVHCTSPNLWFPFRASGFAFYGLQYMILILLLFHRLCVVFEQSPDFAVSKASKIIFYGGFVLFALVMASAGSLPTTDLNMTLNIIGVLITIVLVGWLMGLFIYKLQKLSSQSTEAGDSSSRVGNAQIRKSNARLLVICIKSFILTLLSVVSIVLVVIVFIPGLAASFDNEIDYEFLKSLLFALDLQTNFIGILFGFQAFQAHYLKVFGWCQNKTVACLGATDMMELMSVQSLSIGSTTSPGSAGSRGGKSDQDTVATSKSVATNDTNV